MRAWLELLLTEFFLPHKKCERVGHDFADGYVDRWEYPGTEFRSVADDVTYDALVCSRCKHYELKGEADRSGLQGLELPASTWKQLRRDGYLTRRVW